MKVFYRTTRELSALMHTQSFLRCVTEACDIACCKGYAHPRTRWHKTSEDLVWLYDSGGWMILPTPVCTSQDESLVDLPLLHHVSLAIDVVTWRGSTLQLFSYGCVSGQLKSSQKIFEWNFLRYIRYLYIFNMFYCEAYMLTLISEKKIQFFKTAADRISDISGWTLWLGKKCDLFLRSFWVLPVGYLI